MVQTLRLGLVAHDTVMFRQKRTLRTNLWTWVVANAGIAGVVGRVYFSISGMWPKGLPPGGSYLFSVACKHTTKNRQQDMGLLLHHWILDITTHIYPKF